jgi:hypothetical protein
VPATVAAECKVRTVLKPLNTGASGSNPAHVRVILCCSGQLSGKALGYGLDDRGFESR